MKSIIDCGGQIALTSYTYKAINAELKVFKGHMEGENQKEIIYKLKKSGLYVLSVKPSKSSFAFFQRQLNEKELSYFCRLFSVLYDTNNNLYKAVDYLSKSLKNKKLKTISEGLREDISCGMKLYKSMEKRKAYFPVFFIEVIKLGEKSENLKEVLELLSEYYENGYKFKSEVKTKMTYPIMVLSCFLVAASYLLSNIIPELLNEFQETSFSVPEFSLNMIAFLQKINKNFDVIILLFLVLLLIFKYIYNLNFVKTFFTKFKLKIPVIKEIFKQIYTVKVSGAMIILFKAKLNILECIDILSTISEEEYLRKKMIMCREEIKQGLSITSAFKRSGLFKEKFILMLQMGEESGEMERIITKDFSFLKGDLQEKMDRLLQVVNPVMLIVIGGLVSLFIFKILVPIMNFDNFAY